MAGQIDRDIAGDGEQTLQLSFDLAIGGVETAMHRHRNFAIIDVDLGDIEARLQIGAEILPAGAAAEGDHHKRARVSNHEVGLVHVEDMQHLQLAVAEDALQDLVLVAVLKADVGEVGELGHDGCGAIGIGGAAGRHGVDVAGIDRGDGVELLGRASQLAHQLVSQFRELGFPLGFKILLAAPVIFQQRFIHHQPVGKFGAPRGGVGKPIFSGRHDVDPSRAANLKQALQRGS